MKSIFMLIILILTSLLSAFNSGGHLVIIGGGERPASVMREIVNLAGGNSAKIMIIPIASSDPVNVAEYQVDQFKKLKPSSVNYITFDRTNVNSDSLIQLFNNVNGVFFSGGDQRILTEILLGTKLLDRIKEIYFSGGVIAGTSAGAAVMSEIMITGDELIHENSKSAFGYIQRNNIKTSEGFGFLKNAIIDQHFIYRKRHNRLLSLVLENPNLLGIGIDESTAIKVDHNNILEVIGNYQVIIYDASKANLKNDFGNGMLSAHSIIMHILAPGDKMDLNSNEIIE